MTRATLALLLPGLLAAPVLAQDAEKPKDEPTLEESIRDFERLSPEGEIAIPIRDQVIPTSRGYRYGPWTGRYFASYTALFDDNIFLTHDDEEEDFVHVATLGTRFSREGSDLAVDLTGAGSFEGYARNPDQNFVNAFAQGGFQYGFKKGFLRVMDSFTLRRQATQVSTTQAGTPPVILSSGARVTQTLNEAALAGGYNSEKYALEARYQNTFWDYGRRLESLDAMQHKGTLIGRYAKSPKLELNAQAEYRTLDYDKDLSNDYTTFGAFLGARWAPTPKLALDGRAGWLVQDVDKRGTSTDTSEYKGGSAQLRAIWEATPKLSASLGYSRDIYPAASSNFQAVDAVSATTSWKMTPMWTTSLSAGFQNTNPSNTGMLQYYTGGLRVAYRPNDWFEGALVYGYGARRGDDSNSDYDNHRIGVQLSFLF